MAALAAVVGAAAPARCRGAEVPAGADTAAVVARRAEPVAAPKRRFDAPRWVMLRSLVVPGWGQLHNRAWIKAACIATGEVWLGVRILDEGRSLDRLEAEVNRLPVVDPRRDALVEEYNSQLDGLVARQWLLAALVTYSLLDAYVDAHFRDFGLALEGVTDGGAPGMRLAVRGRF